jgi:hypothetical protein
LAKGAFKQKTCKVSFEHTHIKERGEKIIIREPIVVNLIGSLFGLGYAF